MEIAEKNEPKFSPFDDVDLLETETVAANSESNLSDVRNNAQTDDMEPSFVQSMSDTNFVSAPLGTEQDEVSQDVEAEIVSTSAEVCDSGDGPIAEHSDIASVHISTSDPLSSSLSSEVVYCDSRTFPSADDVSLETSTAVLTLDSDVDSPLRRKTDGGLGDDDGSEVDVAALQRLVVQLTAERDEYKSLYSQSRDDVENYQEQILEVGTALSESTKWHIILSSYILKITTRGMGRLSLV